MQRAVFTVFVILAICSGVGADQGRTEIGPTDTFPIVIDTPGSYVLTADLHVTEPGVNGINITAENVVLDLAGHVVRGPGSGSGSGRGIHGDHVDEILVFNGSVTEFDEGITVIADAIGNSRFHDLTISNCDNRALTFVGGDAHHITAQSNGHSASSGAAVYCGFCTMSSVVARYNNNGISIQYGSAENCTASENLGFGIQVIGSSLTGGAVLANGGDGVYVARSVVLGVSSTANEGWGFLLESASNSNVVNCTGSDNDLGNQSGCGDGNGCHQNYLP